MKIGDDMRFVGIDPSTAGTGLVILSHEGEVIEAVSLKAIKSNDDDPKRFRDLANRLRKHLNPSTDRVLIEGFSFGSKGQGVSVMYGVGWLIRDMLNEHGFKWSEIPPKTLKKFISNNGNAKKPDLIQPTKDKWGFESKSNDIVDAYGLSRIAYSMYNHEGLLKYEQDVLRKLKKI